MTEITTISYHAFNIVR